MQKLDDVEETKALHHLRLVIGGLLLFAALFTWAIGLTLSPHVKPVIAGTEHVRATVLTFKRNGAIGTLILCAVAGTLLLPTGRRAWPIRNWAISALLAMLAATSIYTLVSLPGPPSSIPGGFDENLSASEDVNSATRGVPVGAQDLGIGSATATQAPPLEVASPAREARQQSAQRPVTVDLDKPPTGQADEDPSSTVTDSGTVDDQASNNEAEQ